MSRRFNRNYRLTISLESENIVIEPPMRMAFTSERFTASVYGRIQLQLFNLNTKHRDALIYLISQRKPYIHLRLDVGYGHSSDDLVTVFMGTVTSGSAQRDGTDIINTIECIDGGRDIFYAFTSKNISGSESVITAALADMVIITKGKISEPNTGTRSNILHGYSMQIIVEASKGRDVFIRDEKLHVLKQLEYDDVLSVPVLSAETGMISTPVYEEQFMTVETLYNPKIAIGSVFDLKSSINMKANGLYKCTRITASGDTDGDEWKQTITGIISTDLVPI